ncbi:MAG: DUF4345 domain-containing protein [Candidatus Thiodiazotropha taylori]|nr:DUF4345 domain-containing protein [Candidatus Thiodiazotropha taylori]MCW4223959.1 DUF4345 domain-containing protein [Candidatus Thiodiazotropha endolucinida]MCG8035112.1 DUF4345 domain-containing protein [Candidatus Thiodiazotropha taylori]MCG8076114.1 DUF4345 domain-containing protein [Candidatus Thiodiazotropha taylori]MCG8117973.1 DUF4345 domain-containing protein [Candidatus Thiodiazotropha taylori]
MRKTVYRMLLGLGAFLMFFRFGGPVLIYGTTGPGPFAEVWVEPGNTTSLLLDVDLRFFGALMLGIGLIMIWLMREVEYGGTVLRIIAGAVLVGAIARIYALVQFGSAGMAGTIPIIIEVLLPVALIVLQTSISRDAQSI